MATKKTTPTKAEIEETLNETKDELKDTKNALKEAMALIEELKKQQTPQVIVQSDNRRATSKIKCINLAHNPVNVSTQPHAQGRVFTFNEYGQAHYIKYDDLLDVISSYPNTIDSGMIYIADKDFCEEQGISNECNVYTKDIMDKIVYLRDDNDVELLCGMSAPLLESTINEIVKLYHAGEEMEANKLARIKKELGYDIDKMSESIVDVAND